MESTIKRLPPLNSLKNFESAARLGSFQKAAAELHVTPSAVSHQIKSLESFLDVELFIRQTRHIELTSAGKEYLRSVQKALNEINRATQKLVSSHGTGELTLAVAPAFLSRWLLPRMGKFYETHQNIELEIAASSGLIDFAHSDTDMAVYFGNGDWHDVESHFLKRSYMIPVCAPSLLNRHPINTPIDILKHTLLHVTKRPEEWPNWFEVAQAEMTETRKAMYLSSSQLTAQAAIRGLGVTLQDVSLISDDIQSGQLIAPLDITLELTKSFYLVYQKNRPMTYAMQQFKDWLMAEMAVDALSTAK